MQHHATCDRHSRHAKDPALLDTETRTVMCCIRMRGAADSCPYNELVRFFVQQWRRPRRQQQQPLPMYVFLSPVLVFCNAKLMIIKVIVIHRLINTRCERL